MTRYPSFPYIAPFAVFVGFLALHSVAPMPEFADQLVRLIVLTAVLVFFARPALDLRVTSLFASIGIGIAVFAIWIAPDLLSPAYRHSWLFENAITGTARSSLSDASRTKVAVLVMRSLRAIAIVPIVEELFWRAWLMRWLIAPDFQKVPLGAYAAMSFWGVAVLFASEHGAYWDVGLAAGIVYNWWMLRTKSVGDLILAHAVTNGCLCAYVIATGKWEYWL
ncbi:MAG TPA: CAAX prenyl protease-related protein [Bryobacteraceae bacterium]|nr:CAAX prenyl protease-related protein [Bryobacteraceae bacterium]